MAMSRRKATTGIAAALLLTCLTATAQGFMGVGSSSSNAPERMLQIKGKIVCTACSLKEARTIQPNTGVYLYQVKHLQGQLVMEVQWVSNPRWFGYLTVPQIWVRGEDSIVQKLTAEENHSKDVEIKGFLANPRTIDINEVTIRQ